MLRKPTLVALLIVPLLLPLGGCAGIVESAIGAPSGLLTSSVQNPVTKNTLFRVENALRVAVAGLQTYKNYCNAQPVGDRCDAIVGQLQGYSVKSRPLVKQLRVFVRRNDQVNAQKVFATLRAVFVEYQTLAAREGLPVPTIGVQ